MKQGRLALGVVGGTCLGISLASCSVILGLDGLEPREGGAAAPDGSVGDVANVDGNRDAQVSCNYRCTSNEDVRTVQASCGGGAWVDAGVCQGQCSISGRCLDTIATAEHPLLVAVDTERVYWTNPVEAGVDGSVLSCALDGSAPLVIASNQRLPNGIAVDSEFVYWTDTIAGSVFAYDKTTGVVSTIATAQPAASDILLGNGNVYWTNTMQGTVVGAPVTKTNTVTTYAKGQQYPVFAAVDSENIYWTNLYSMQTSLARVRLAGGDPLTIATGNPYQVAVDDKFVYWTDEGTGRVSKTAKNGNGSQITLFSLSEHAWSLALDDGNVYWGTTDGRVVRATVEGDDVVTLASSPGIPGNLAIGATSIYWPAGHDIERLWPK